jgi:adenylate cyclase
MTQIVMDEKGTLDKYIGDAIMAFWNAPKELPDHATRALRTAVLMQRRMEHLNSKWRLTNPEHEDLVVRIGINTGTVVVGNVGGEERFDYSAIGDPVNLAARLEPANKSYDTLVMASQFTLDAADAAAFRFRELDLIAVKGKVEPVKVYEILEMAGVELPARREEAIRLYEAGLQAYKRRDWEGAAAAFQAALDADPDDGPSTVYLERATEYAAAPPPPDWDFVVRRTQK